MKRGIILRVSLEILHLKTELKASRKSGKTSALKRSPLRASINRLTIPTIR